MDTVPMLVLSVASRGAASTRSDSADRCAAMRGSQGVLIPAHALHVPLPPRGTRHQQPSHARQHPPLAYHHSVVASRPECSFPRPGEPPGLGPSALHDQQPVLPPSADGYVESVGSGFNGRQARLGWKDPERDARQAVAPHADQPCVAIAASRLFSIKLINFA